VVADVISDPQVVFMFPNPEKVSPPLCRLDEALIGYKSGAPILTKVNLNVDLDTRIALIGPNGAGKSTLIKALVGQLELQDGYQFTH
jgi:ATP-binding cassette subfamily F protein 3